MNNLVTNYGRAACDIHRRGSGDDLILSRGNPPRRLQMAPLMPGSWLYLLYKESAVFTISHTSRASCNRDAREKKEDRSVYSFPVLNRRS